MGHAQRAHALLNASGAYRWMECTPSARLEEQFTDQTTEAASEGTLAHELAEMKVRNYFQTTEFSKKKLAAGVRKLRKDPLWDNEMEVYTDVYLDYIKTTALAFDTAPYVAIEKKVDFSTYVPDGFGTADCILIVSGVIHVIDFKYGKSPDGRVSAEGNPQLALYALGAYETYKLLYPVDRIRMSIVQPRLPDGVSEWECSLKELLAFGNYAKERAQMAINGEGEYRPSAKICRYCRARAQCRARAEKNVEIAFGGLKLPPLISNADVGKYLSQGEDISRWLKDLQEYALKECLSGKEIPGWKAVEGRGSRDWTDMDVAFAILEQNGIDEALLWERKPLTLAQVEKTVGKKVFTDLVGDMVIKNPGKPTLAPESDKREAITNKISAKDAFKEDL